MLADSVIRVRAAEPSDASAWVRLRTELWPESPADHPPEIEEYFRAASADVACFVAEDGGGNIIGIAEVGTRPWAEGCRTSPVGYLEGIYVMPGVRRSGAARALVAAAAEWSRSLGCTEMGSDRAIDNTVSGAFHEAVGFEEVSTIVCYRKDLDR